MDARRFYWKRLVRIVPLYLVTNLMVVPLMYLGHLGTRPNDAALNYLTLATGTPRSSATT